jgi:hemolysin D
MRFVRAKRRGRDPVDREAVHFQPDAVMIEERPLPWFARSVVYLIVALVVSAALWASLSQVDRVVTRAAS